MIRVAIIGTAGRKEHSQYMSCRLYAEMLKESHRIITEELKLDPTSLQLVSGGAAWADFVAVDLFNEQHYAALKLYLPPESFTSAKRYHAEFSRITQKNSLKDIQYAVQSGAECITCESVWPRNTRIAEDCDHLIALSFGKNEPETAGTLFTWNKTKCPKIFVNLLEFITP